MAVYNNKVGLEKWIYVVDNAICTVSTTYRIAYHVTIWSQNFNGNTWLSSAGIPAHFTLIANSTLS